MNTFLLSKGRTSSGAIFWLIPAIRRKDRCGPGITACGWAESVPFSADKTAAELACAGSTAAGCSLRPANKSQVKRANTNRADRQTGGFTAGFPSERARLHVTWNLLRKAGDVFHSRNRNVELRFGETELCSRISMWAKYLISCDDP